MELELTSVLANRDSLIDVLIVSSPVDESAAPLTSLASRYRDWQT